MVTRFGLPLAVWDKAKDEIRTILIDDAKEQAAPISSSTLAAKITAAQLEPHSYALFHLLGEISEEEHEAGRGMLSALVISKEHHLPGPGFFALGEKRGFNTVDRDAFWLSQLNRVHLTWGKK